MAAKALLKTLVVLMLLMAGAMAIVIVRTRLLSISQRDEARFIATYVDLSVASGKFQDSPDSLRAARAEAFRVNETDSAWIEAYSKGLSGDLSKSAQIWDEIIVKLDSIRATPPKTDSLSIF